MLSRANLAVLSYRRMYRCIYLDFLYTEDQSLDTNTAVQVGCSLHCRYICPCQKFPPIKPIFDFGQALPAMRSSSMVPQVWWYCSEVKSRRVVDPSTRRPLFLSRKKKGWTTQRAPSNKSKRPEKKKQKYQQHQSVSEMGEQIRTAHHRCVYRWCSDNLFFRGEERRRLPGESLSLASVAS